MFILCFFSRSEKDKKLLDEKMDEKHLYFNIQIPSNRQKKIGKSTYFTGTQIGAKNHSGKAWNLLVKTIVRLWFRRKGVDFTKFSGKCRDTKVLPSSQRFAYDFVTKFPWNQLLHDESIDFTKYLTIKKEKKMHWNAFTLTQYSVKKYYQTRRLRSKIPWNQLFSNFPN